MSNRRIFHVQITKDSLDRFFDIGLHSSWETPFMFNIGFFGNNLWVSFFDTVSSGSDWRH